MHHLHVWHLDEHRSALEAHASDSPHGIEDIKASMKRLLREDVAIEHSTLEFEPREGPAHEEGRGAAGSHAGIIPTE